MKPKITVITFTFCFLNNLLLLHTLSTSNVSKIIGLKIHNILFYCYRLSFFTISMCKCRNVTLKTPRTSPKMKRRLPIVKEEKRSPKNICNSDLAIYTMVISTAVLSYVNSLNGDFVHDDIPAIVTNGDVVGRGSIRELFLNDFWGTAMVDPNSHKSYRPLTTLSFR